MIKSRVVRTAILTVATTAVGLFLWASQNKVRIKFAAGSMRPTVVKFLGELEHNYLSQHQSVPVFSLMARAGIVPKNIEDEKKIGHDGTGGVRVISFTLDGKKMVSDGIASTAVVFPYLLNNKSGCVAVNIPAHLSATVRRSTDANGNQSLTFLFDDPIAIQLDATELNLPFPKSISLTSLTVGDNALIYAFSSSAVRSSGDSYEIYLDLTRSN